MNLLAVFTAVMHWCVSSWAFQPSASFRSRLRPISRLQSSVQDNSNNNNKDSSIQWELLKKHHARGSWKGIWTTYDYIGDVVLEAVASVDCTLSAVDESQIDVVHNIVVGAQRSDCSTCFDAMEIKTIPVCTFTPDNLTARKTRLGACGMVVGPTLLRSGSSK